MKQLKIFLFIGIFLFSSSLLTSLYAQPSVATSPAVDMPRLEQKVGQQDISLGPARYPLFTEAIPKSVTKGHTACKEKLLKVYDEKTKEGISLAFIPGAQTDFVKIDDLSFEVSLEKENRKAIKVQINWVIRVEGQRPDEYDTTCIIDGKEKVKKKDGLYYPFPCLCDSWHGTTKQLFKGGTVFSKIKVNGKDIGELIGEVEPLDAEAKKQLGYITMTIPDGTEEKVTQVYDPTMAGSVLLVKEHFKGEFPKQLKIEVYWKNDTALKLTSPANTHQVIVSIIPVNN
ncbi:MAG: hypothetical protein N2606_06410 [Candidatus Omnitrophica bacterium]|nr:hypothetical protein [Candidatus Omnitrophota bacterium]